MSRRPLKIAYLCDITPLDPNLYSGGNSRIYQALQKHVGEVTILSNSWFAAEPLRRLMHMLPEAINLRARWRLHLVLKHIIARGLKRELAKDRYDVVFCAYSFQSMAGLKLPYPMVTAFTADATPITYKNSAIGEKFGSYVRQAKLMDKWLAREERAILKAADLLLLPTEWLKNSIADAHSIDLSEIDVIPWGANIDDIPQARIAPPLSAQVPLELLFVGRDWHAKGGPLALDVMGCLRSRGIDARLTVVGSVPPGSETLEHVRVIPGLDKSDPTQMAQFEAVFRKAHFLINPSFESFGFAFCEASAYGLPSLSYRVGGVPLKEGVNGHALPIGAGANDFADVICKYVQDPESHAALRLSARREFEQVLNWDAWGVAVRDRLWAQIDA